MLPTDKGLGILIKRAEPPDRVFIYINLMCKHQMRTQTDEFGETAGARFGLGLIYLNGIGRPGDARFIEILSHKADPGP